MYDKVGSAEGKSHIPSLNDRKKFFKEEPK